MLDARPQQVACYPPHFISQPAIRRGDDHFTWKTAFGKGYRDGKAVGNLVNLVVIE